MWSLQHSLVAAAGVNSWVWIVEAASFPCASNLANQIIFHCVHSTLHHWVDERIELPKVISTMLSAIIHILCKIQPQGLGAWNAVGVKLSLTFSECPSPVGFTDCKAWGKCSRKQKHGQSMMHTKGRVFTLILKHGRDLMPTYRCVAKYLCHS
jgi:hypothetical protein